MFYCILSKFCAAVVWSKPGVCFQHSKVIHMTRSLSISLPPPFNTTEEPNTLFPPWSHINIYIVPHWKITQTKRRWNCWYTCHFKPSYPGPPRTKLLTQWLWAALETWARFSFLAPKEDNLKSLENVHSHDPRVVLPNHFPSGLSVMRIISIGSPCLKLSSFFPPLTSQQALAWWMTSMGPVSCKEEKKTITQASLLFRESWRNAAGKPVCPQLANLPDSKRYRFKLKWRGRVIPGNAPRGAVKGNSQGSGRTRGSWGMCLDLGESGGLWTLATLRRACKGSHWWPNTTCVWQRSDIQVDAEGWETAGIRRQCVHIKAGLGLGSSSNSEKLCSKTSVSRWLHPETLVSLALL